MRESLVALLVMIGILGGYYHLKKMGMSLVPTIAPSPTNTINESKNKPKGTKHDQTNVNKHVESRSNYRKGTRSSSEADETESLPTLYSTAEEPTERRVNKGEGPARNKPIIGGVPVKAWIDSRRHALSSSQDAAPTEDGMRVFLQCMELKKKGPEYLQERDCESLLADRNGNLPKAHWQ